MELLEKNGVPIPRGRVAKSASEADAVARSLNTEDLVIKAQVLAGGRGKGHFDSGLKGGVKLVNGVDEIKPLADQMIGHKIFTKQTGAFGRKCNAVQIVERKYLRREFYFALVMDRAAQGPVIVASSEGGMDIEAVAATTPEAIVTHPININEGLSRFEAISVAEKIGMKGNTAEQAADIFLKLYNIFVQNDATLIEINPLGETSDRQVLCMDAKFGFDDNASFRHPDVYALRDTTQEDPREVAAHKWDLNYIGLEGHIGCL
ncbi:hypothetical protein HK102_012666, partial [Quaeritorhiza haematococci]